MRNTFFLVLIVLFASSSYAQYLVGAGISDITGPSTEVGFMGYGQLNQVGTGIHFRLRARAYVFVDKQTNARVAYVNLDLCFTSIQLKKRVVTGLQQLLPGFYSHANVLLTATHTHSGPAGYTWYTIYNVPCLGAKEANTAAIVAGILDAIVIAHKSARSGRILFSSGDLSTPQTNINRSPSAYANNPASEKAKYSADVEKGITGIRIQADDGTDIGSINWFAVHGTSMNNTNTHISGDNKGYASYLFEQAMNGKALPGEGSFVAAFTNTNEGDVSPNTRGAHCPDGTPCDNPSSTCNGTAQGCIASGPGKDMIESTKIIGTQQFTKAYELFRSARTPLSGRVNYRHMFVDMENVMVEPKYTGLPTAVKTCIGALGDSFAAGTTDGPGDFDFKQGTNSTSANPFWNALGHLLANPPADVVACQAPKPILLYTGGASTPSRWTPNILPVQLVQIGYLYIAAVPSEFTTMSGRRLKDTIKSTLIANGASPNLTVVVAGLANAYSQYVTTSEEYQIQRYEGASTLFGPYTLNAYQQLFATLATAVATNTTVPAGKEPQDFTGSVPDFVPGVFFDDGPIGQVRENVKPVYRLGDTVKVVFHSADPRNNFRNKDTFLTVELKSDNNTWQVVATDSNWETKFSWAPHLSIELGESLATITWNIPTNAEVGTYRIMHFGNKKSLFGGITPFSGTSSEFKVTL